MSLKGKTALVTGSTSGIGLAYAKALAGQGANLVINGFGDAAAIEQERLGLEATSGGKALYSAHDLTKVDQIEAMMKEAADTFGGVDILINNAGTQHVSPIEEFPVDKWNLIIALNLSSAFHTTRLAVPYMKQRTHLPIVVDPSHGTGIRDLVGPMALAAAACGADGLLIEVHENPSVALSDGAQSLYPDQFAALMPRVSVVLAAVGRIAA